MSTNVVPEVSEGGGRSVAPWFFRIHTVREVAARTAHGHVHDDVELHNRKYDRISGADTRFWEGGLGIGWVDHLGSLSVL